MTGSIKLWDHPSDMVRFSCARCGRRGQYRKRNLIAQFGPDIALPDLRHEIALCELHQKAGDACSVHFIGLAGVPKPPPPPP
jgi:hypothetical protein